jgi:hypothetical protein
MYKERFIINRNTLLHVSTLLGHLQGELSVCQARTAEGSRPQKQRSTQSTPHSHSTVKCNPSVTVTESSPWRWPSRVETCRSVLRLMIKLSLCISWWFVLLNDFGTISIKYCKCKFVCLPVILHANGILSAQRWIAICGMSGCTIFFILSHKRHDCR